jgi:hypothetical protein
MPTFKEKYNKKYNYDKDQSHSLEDIAKETGIKLSILQEVYNRGVGAYKTNPQSVRNKDGKKREGGYPKSQRMSKEQWGFSRVLGFVGRNRKQIAEGAPDRDLYLKTK